MVDRRRSPERRTGRRTPTPSSTAAGSCPASSTRTVTSGWASTARSTTSTRRSRRPRPNATSARCCCATAARRSTPAASTTATTCRASSGPVVIWPGRSATSAASPIELEDESQLPDAVAEQARWGDGWVKLVGDWIDREVGDLAPLWSDDVLKAGDRRRARRRCPRHRPRLQRGCAAGPHQGGHRLHRARHRNHRRHHRADGRARHRAGADADQHRELSRHRRRGGQVSGVRAAHARPVRELPDADRRGAGRGRADLRGHRCGQHDRARPHRRRSRRAQADRDDARPRRWARRAGRHGNGSAGPGWSTARRRIWCATPTTRGRARPSSTTRRP